MRAPHSPRSKGHGLSWPRRLLVAACAGTAATFVSFPLASAHVAVSPDTVQPGKAALLSFRVPAERDDAATTRLEVTFPADRPLSSVTPEALPGWTIEVRRQPAAVPAGMDAGMDDDKSEGPVSSISWTGGAVPAGTFQDFPVRVGELPDSGTLTFTAVQTYSDGQVVHWSDPMRQGQPEPEHPAPSVTITPPPAAPPASTSDTAARVLGGAGVLVGAAGIGVALTRRRAR